MEDDEKRRIPLESVESIQHAFYSDRNGDRMNLQYGALHSGDIPKYRPVGGGRSILGLAAGFIALRGYGKGIEIGPREYGKASSLTDSTSRALLLKPPCRRLFPSESSKYQEIDGFIRLPTRSDGKDTEKSYRSITQDRRLDHSDSSSSSDSESNADSSETEADRPALTAHQETLKQLEQDLILTPQSVDTWLSLLDKSLTAIPIRSKNANKARSEISVSILSRALSAHPQNSRNMVLRLAYLRAGEGIWHESKLKSEWNDALKIGGIELHMEWLEWRIRTGNNGIDGVVEAAVRTVASLGSDDDCEVAKVRILWRMTTAIRSAGYAERAMAIYQAQAELAFFMPPSVSKLPFDAQLNELEYFWDAEVPRVGEAGAQGWKVWHSSKSEEKPPANSHSIRPIVVMDLDPYRLWAKQELQWDRTLYTPQRSDSDSPDPYSTVFFSDIRPALLNIKTRSAKHAFRMAWLSFLGLRTPDLSMASSGDLDWDDRWNLGHLTSPPYLNAIFPPDLVENKSLSNSVAGTLIGRERQYGSPFGPVRSWSKNVSGPLDMSSAEPGKMKRSGMWTSDDVSIVDEPMLRHLFAALEIPDDDNEWEILALAFALAVNPKSAVGLSKTLLSRHRESLALWNAHAQLEGSRGRRDEARKVYQTTLALNRSHNKASCLWWNWAEMEWLAGDDHAALIVILKSVEMKGPASGVTLLRAKCSLECEYDKPSLGWKQKEYWIKMRALLELLTGNQPTSALAIFDIYITHCPDEPSKESLLTASLLMIYYHGVILKKPMQPHILRERARQAFESSPNNSIILGILLEAEKGQGIWGYVRAMLSGNDGKPKGVARRVADVWIAGWEKGRWVTEIERTRNGLAAAVEHERTKFSPVIWRIYIEFEIRVGALHHAKKLLFRAIGECPLVKELYLLAFGPLRGVFQVHELKGLADTMAERGIRLRQGLDEVVGVLVDEGKQEEREESGDEDEIEHNARELRRLMPY